MDLITDTCKCHAVIWGGGNGKQCNSKNIINGTKYCKNHQTPESRPCGDINNINENFYLGPDKTLHTWNYLKKQNKNNHNINMNKNNAEKSDNKIIKKINKKVSDKKNDDHIVKKVENIKIDNQENNNIKCDNNIILNTIQSSNIFDLINNYIIEIKQEKYNTLYDYYHLFKINNRNNKWLRNNINDISTPTKEQRKNNAEVPTCPELVDELLNISPRKLWTNIVTVCDLSCGKANIILGIFDQLYNGLKKKYKDDSERASIIIDKCIYYADIDKNNVIITTYLLCAYASYLSNADINNLLKLTNSYVGDSLKIDVLNVWGFKEFDISVQNPPYE